MQLIDHQRPLVDAVASPRVHHQWMPDEITHEESLPAPTVDALKIRGHAMRARTRIGVANCIEVDPKTGALIAVADVNRDGGKAAAW
jgi:gamma-glutamyltranspeptidase / glutathione hydrolase